MWERLDQEYIMATAQRLPIIIEKGQGNYLYDRQGNSYLDLFTGLGVNILGHSHPRIVEALREQGKRYLHVSNFFYNPPAIKLAKRLVDHTVKAGKVCFSNSGSEASEIAIKLIHKWCLSQAKQKSGILVLKNSFHGRTLGALQLTRQASIYQDYPALDLPIIEVEPNNIEQLHDAVATRQPAAILVEPILGSGGVIPLNPIYLKTIQTICQEKNILFCVDEIQTGLGRTGTLFAYQQANLDPDLILFAKGVGGGLPLGGVIAKSPLSEQFQPGDHGSTFSPSPLSAALGNTLLDILIDEKGLVHAKQTAHQLWESLRKIQQKYPKQIVSIQGKGLMIGIHTSLSKQQISQFQQYMLQNGMVINITAGTVIRLLPPLTLTSKEISYLYEHLNAWLQNGST